MIVTAQSLISCSVYSLFTPTPLLYYHSILSHVQRERKIRCDALREHQGESNLTGRTTQDMAGWKPWQLR